MQLIETICYLKTFMVVILSGWYEFVVYKHFRQNNIQRNEEYVRGKCVVVTGGSSGIGKSSAREFAERGATVVMGDVDLENGEKAVQKMQKQTGKKCGMVQSITNLDLSDMDSVEQFAQKICAEHPKIKFLQCNAGIGNSKDENIKTKDGFNIHIAVNYMGHFLLTNLLMKNLEAEMHPSQIDTQAASEYVMYCAIDKSIENEANQIYRFRKHFNRANEKINAELAKSLWEKSSDMVRLNERLARITKDT